MASPPTDAATLLARLDADGVVFAMANLDMAADDHQAAGATALRHFLIVKRHELAMFETHVHPWERETYLEVV